ncbi:TCP-1/cpn60 chaperonin family-domain-containing protein [Fusarium acuminatum]|uniref:TCP-1/cpn60 chaperonin family-domain-containing protein n=1 Tax=Fusarium acuminatum TaxID=5515 RepID=A0ABZ2X2N4_9HYPO
MWPPVPSSPPLRTPLAVTFEDTDSESEIGLPDYESISPVVARLEKLTVSHKNDEVEDSFTTDDCTSIEDDTSFESKTLNEGSTPPESPIEAFLPRPETPKAHCPWDPAAKFKFRNGRVYTYEQLQVMALELAEARHNGEFPLDAEDISDAHAVVEDFNSLNYLRRIRGNLAAPAPDSYIHLRDQIALGIQQRHAAHQREAHQEVTRRVNHYLQAVEAEQRYYNAATTTLQRCGVAHPVQQDFIDPNDDMCSVVEHTIEQGIADATGPLRMNVGRLQEQTGALGKYAGNLQQQSKVFQEQTRLLEQQTIALQKHTSDLQEHAGALQQQSVWQSHQQDKFFQQQLSIIEKQNQLYQRRGFSSRAESRFFDKRTGALKKHTGALEQQNQAMRQNLEYHNASLTQLHGVIGSEMKNNRATAHNLASANQLVNNLAEEFPKAIKKALDEAAQKQADELLERITQVVREEALALPNTDTALQTEKVGQKKKFVEGSDKIERSERSSLYRMVCKFKRRRISRD